MRHREALQSLREVCQLLEHHDVLPRDQGRDVTPELDTVDRRASKKLNRPEDWAIKVTTEHPLTVTCVDDKTKHLRVDVSGVCPAPQDGRPGEGHSVTIRVWSTRESDWHDPNRDHPDLVKTIHSQGKGRVMVRVRFDKEDEKGSGPWSHLQVGGKPGANEFCPFPPPGFNYPSFLHPPMDFVLALEFVTKTFCESAYEEVKNEEVWRAAVCQSQREYTSAYFDRLRMANRVKDMTSSLLEHCWACPV